MSDTDWVAKAQETPLAVKHLINGELQDATVQQTPIDKRFSQDGRLLYRFDAGHAALRDCARSMDQLFSLSGSDGGLMVYQQRKPLAWWAASSAGTSRCGWPP